MNTHVDPLAAGVNAVAPVYLVQPSALRSASETNSSRPMRGQSHAMIRASPYKTGHCLDSPLRSAQLSFLHQDVTTLGVIDNGREQQFTRTPPVETHGRARCGETHQLNPHPPS